MKNLSIFFTILMIVFFTSNTLAQSPIFGARAGVNFANISVDDESLDSKIGLVLGAIANFPISDLFSVQPELTFVQRGAEEEGFSGSTLEGKLKFSNINLPINAKVSFDVGSAKVFALAGPNVGFSIGGEVEACDGGSCASEDLEFDDTDGLKRFDLGLNLGAGVQFGQIFIDLRYVLGLTNISDSDDTDVNHRGFQASVGYMFGSN